MTRSGCSYQSLGPRRRWPLWRGAFPRFCRPHSWGPKPARDAASACPAMAKARYGSGHPDRSGQTARPHAGLRGKRRGDRLGGVAGRPRGDPYGRGHRLDRFWPGKERAVRRAAAGTSFLATRAPVTGLGRAAMGLFSKEADGRAPRGALYEIVRREFGLTNDFYFTDVIQERWAPSRLGGGFPEIRLPGRTGGRCGSGGPVRGCRRGAVPAGQSPSGNGGLFAWNAFRFLFRRAVQGGRTDPAAFGASTSAGLRAAKAAAFPTEGALLLAIDHFT